MTDKTLGWLILIGLAGLVTGTYLIAWRAGYSSVRQGAAWIVAALSLSAGTVGIAAYAIPSLSDFRNPSIPISTAILGNVFI